MKSTTLRLFKGWRPLLSSPGMRQSIGEDKRESFLASMLDTFPKEVRPDAAELTAEMIRRKQRYFACNQRKITRVCVAEVSDGFHLAVASFMSGQE